MDTTTVAPAELSAAVRETIEETLSGTVFTVSDLLRAGSAHTTQKYGWGAGGEACALSAAAIAAESIGLLD